MKILGGKKTKALKRDSPKSNIMVYDLKKKQICTFIYIQEHIKKTQSKAKVNV